MKSKRGNPFILLLRLGILFSVSFFSSVPFAWAAPRVLSIAPGSLGQGASARNIAVIGSGFQCGASVSFSDPSLTTSRINLVPGTSTVTDQFYNQCGSAGIIPSNVQFFSNSNIFFYIDVSPSTPVGPVTVTFTNPPPSSGGDGLSTSAVLNISAPPVIQCVVLFSSSFSGNCPVSPLPPTVPQGGTVTLQVAGSGFQNGAVLLGSFTVNSLYVNGNGTVATANITVSKTAAPSLNSVTLANPDGGSVLFASALLVQWVLGDKTPAMTVYEDPRLTAGTRIPLDAFWNGAWSGEGTIIPFSNLIYYLPTEMVLKPHPSLFQQVMGHHVGAYLDFQIWSKGAWGNQLTMQSYQNSKNFDIAFESNSGNGLVVYGINNGIGYRQIFQTGTAANCDPALGVSSPCWGPETALTTIINSNPIYLYAVKLIANPDRTKNEILAAYLDSAGRLFVRSWNGSQFSLPEVQVSAATRIDPSTFDLAYMQTTNRIGMLGWLEAGNGTPKSCLWDGTTCWMTTQLSFSTTFSTTFTINSTPAQTGTSPTTGNLFRIQLSADPFSDQIALGTVENIGFGSSANGNFVTEIWDGKIWSAGSYSFPANSKGVYAVNGALSPTYLSYDWNSFNLIWKNGTPASQLFTIYTNSSGGLHYQIWNPASGWSGDVAIPGMLTDTSGLLPLFNSVEFDSDPRSGDILGGMKSQDSLLASIRWDGNTSSWVEYSQLTPITTNSDVIPFGLSYFRDFPTITSMNPPPSQQVPQGASITVTLNGTLIKDFATLTFPGFTQSAADLTTVTHNFSSGIDTLTATGKIADNAAPGIFGVTVTNPDGSLVVGKNGIGLINIILNPASSVNVTTVFPASRGQGASNQILTLTGYNFPASFAVTFSGNGSDIAVTPSTISALSGATQVTIQVNISPTAAAGPKDLILTSFATTPSQSFTFPNIFTVNYGPSILNVSPATLLQGATQNIVVSGNDFQPGASLIISNGAQTLGWNSPGGTPSNLFQNRMTGNRFKFPASSPYVVLNQVSVLTSLVDPAKINGQVAVYYDQNNLPGSLIQASGITPLNQFSCIGNPCVMSFNVSSPITLDTSRKYWVLFNAEGLQTLLFYDSNQTSGCNGDTPCLSVSTPQTFGTWPVSGTSISTSSWNSVSGGNRYAISLLYQPVFGSIKIGVTSGSPNNNQMTGSNILTFSGSTPVKGIYFYVENVDPLNRSASLAIYDSAGTDSLGNPGAPLNQRLLRAPSTYNINITNLTPNSFNFFPMPANFSLPAGTYWVLVNVNGAGTTFKYDTGSLLTSVQAGQPYGIWPITFPSATSTLMKSTYSSFAVGNFPPTLGTAGGAGSEGPDSNQMTASQFTTTSSINPTINIVGLSFYVDTIDPVNSSGSAALYDDNNGTPGNLIVSTASQSLKPSSFNAISVPLTQVAAGKKYWIVVNVNGRGTTLTYDDGTSVNSVKKPNSFTNPWPPSGGGASTWIPYPLSPPYQGRRYAFGIVPDITVSNSFVISGNSISGGVTASPNANATPGLSRPICVANPDGGTACVTSNGTVPYFQILPAIKTKPALNAYGSLASSPYPAYREWLGFSPWNFEAADTLSAGAAPNWSVLRAFPNANIPGGATRIDEKILGTLSNTALTLQVRNGGIWGSSFNAVPSTTFSRSFDLAYETGTGRGVAVYGISGSSSPQYQIWNGTAWNGPFSVPGTPAGTPLWVRLEPNPVLNSNEIILAYLSGIVDPVGGTVTSAVLHVLVWNGINFLSVPEQTFNIGSVSDNINLCLTCIPPVIGQLFDIAYEHNSGRAIVAWGVTNSSTPSYNVWNGTAWSGTFGANQASASAGTSLIYFKLAGDPNSNQIAMGTAAVDGKAYDIQFWDGNGIAAKWGSPSLMSDNLLYDVSLPAGNPQDPNFNVGRNFDLAWEKDSGALLTVFASSTSVNSCGYTDQFGNPLPRFPYGTRFRIWDPTLNKTTGQPIGWSADALVPQVGRDLVPRWIQLIPEPTSNALFLEISGQPVTVYNPIPNPNINPSTPICIISENPATHITNPAIVHYHHYEWNNRGWADKEELNTSLSGALKSFIGFFQFYTAYGESFMTAFHPDDTLPSPVTDLIVTGVTGSTATLQWTSTGDDGNLGKASQYTIYYSTSSNFSSSTPVKVSPVFTTLPAVAETYSYTVTGLTSSTTYYFAISATDRAGNTSLLSTLNPPVSVMTSTSAALVPNQIQDLVVVPGSLLNNSVQLTWTAPVIGGSYSGAMKPAYDLRWATFKITDNATFNNATPFLAADGTGRNGLSPAHTAGTREFFNFVGIPNAVIYFALKTCDPGAVNPVTLTCPTGGAENIYPLNLTPKNYPFDLTPVPLDAAHQVSVDNRQTGTGTVPQAITDLAVTSVGANSMTLRWTVPANAAQYDIRYSTSPITQSNFLSARQVFAIPAPSAAGLPQSVTVTNLLSGSSGISYYFAIETIDSSGNNSVISTCINCPAATLRVYDFTPPDPIKNLSIVPNGTGKDSITLTWIATGDDGPVGTATQYDIRYSTFPIVSDAQFQSALQVTNPPPPLPSGNLEYFKVSGLTSNTLYYFAIKAIDKGGNFSLLPTLPQPVCANCPGHTALHSGYNLVSVPYLLSAVSDPASVFGNDVSRPVTIYQWISGSYTVPSFLTEGGGYFLYATGNNSVLKASDAGGNLLGVPESRTTVTVGLQNGWNMIGNPYLHPLYLKDACVKSGNGPSVPFPAAAASLVIGNSIYAYDGTKYLAEIYHDSTPAPFNKPDAEIDPWNSYWIQLYASGSDYSLILMNTPGACP